MTNIANPVGTTDNVANAIGSCREINGLNCDLICSVAVGNRDIFTNYANISIDTCRYSQFYPTIIRPVRESTLRASNSTYL